MSRVPVLLRCRLTRKRLIDAGRRTARKPALLGDPGRTRPLSWRLRAAFPEITRQFTEGDRIRHFSGGRRHAGRAVQTVHVDHAVGDLHPRDVRPGHLVAVLGHTVTRDHERAEPYGAARLDPGHVLRQQALGHRRGDHLDHFLYPGELRADDGLGVVLAYERTAPAHRLRRAHPCARDAHLLDGVPGKGVYVPAGDQDQAVLVQVEHAAVPGQDVADEDAPGRAEVGGGA